MVAGMACSRGTGGSGSFYRPCGDAVRTASLVVHCQSCYDGGARRVVVALRECLHRWCGPRSSKPVAGVNNARCRFDSDTLPLVFCRHGLRLLWAGLWVVSGVLGLVSEVLGIVSLRLSKNPGRLRG